MRRFNKLSAQFVRQKFIKPGEIWQRAESVSRCVRTETFKIGAGIYKRDFLHGGEIAADWSKRLDVKAIKDNARVVELSGGNQQKIVIGKGLAQKPRLVIFDEPTPGVDVRAIAEIHCFINNLADEGITVVVISSYLPEIMILSDRILNRRQGRVVEEISPIDATEEQVMFAAVH